MTLHLKILQMMHHPVKRLPLPYIYASINFPLNNEPEYTEKSNAVPPCWNRNTFIFNLPISAFEGNDDENEQNLRITIIESRLFMVEEPLGFCDIFIPSLPKDKIIIQWATLTPCPNRSNLPKMMILLMIQCNTTEGFSPLPIEKNMVSLNENSYDNDVFNAPLASPDEILQLEPWDQREVELKYLEQIHIKNLIFSSMELQNELDHNENDFQNNDEELEYQSPLKSILKMFY